MADDDAPHVCFFDLETQDRIDAMPGRYRDEKVRALRVSCASVVTIPSELCLDPADRERAFEMAQTKTYWCDGEGDSSLPALCSALEKAEMSVGFNVSGFDWPVMKKYFSTTEAFDRAIKKSHDIFSRVRDATGFWYKLDRLLALNGLEMKTGDGLIAIEYWRLQQREPLQHYCEVDTQQCCKLALLPVLELGDGRRLDNYNFGVASALAALRRSNELAACAPA